MTNKIRALAQTYQNVERDIVFLILANLCIQLINSAFFLILNIYMAKVGFTDPVIADLISLRFLAVVCFAIPFGLFIKGKPLRPVFYTAAIGMPIVSLGIVEGVAQYGVGAAYWSYLLYLFMFLWGVGFSMIHVCVLPFILRNAAKETHTETITLHFISWSLGMIIAGGLISALSYLFTDFFTEQNLLRLFCVLGCCSVFFLSLMRKKEKVEQKTEANQKDFYKYDWGVIARVVIPISAIAIGAGLTIPFMNLFFFHTFQMDSEQYALLGTVTSCLVVGGGLLVPVIKQRFGYEAVTYTQSLSVCALFLLGTTDFISTYPFAIYMAIGCYIIRQPLMNLANPMTSEMGMYYVGERNQEILSAIVSSIWSGSWFVSAQIFRWLRAMELPYGYVFYLTTALYVVGITLYYFLILDFRRKERETDASLDGRFARRTLR